MKNPKPRNPYVESARLRKAGRHEDKKAKFEKRISGRLELTEQLAYEKELNEKDKK